MDTIFKAISAFFLSLTSFFAPARLSTPVDGVAPSPPPPLPSATPTYQTTTFTHTSPNYQFNYPVNTTPEKLALRTDYFPFPGPITSQSLLTTDLMCTADGPGGFWECQNTAVRPFTNPQGAAGFLVKRTKDMSGTKYDDVAYVFPHPGSKNYGLILAIEEPTKVRLEVLRQIADSFQWQ